ncbi:M1 family metallopeptidase [Pseudoxanthomonas indica]|uniref:Aminopeptidase N n=1 Tax=Pseudoxanthomonas indica TaxID=428993 RepID=A0A1T5LWR7_9GAMM|nr:M1 family metallopeptidase [Pseudoxanthomonas indica]GGD41303.1 peptidase M1 [Pseudoxanthomonas indica]SKC80411.1 Peptidase family M1 [Pseudoxanthomonas indica]
MKMTRLVLALGLACAAVSAHAEQPALTAMTEDTGVPRTPEQAAVVFEHADLGFKVLPDSKRLEGDATLTFRASAALSKLVVDLDRNYQVSRVEVDGQAVATGGWRNPEGKMSVDLPKPVASGQVVKLRIVYAGQPHVATRAPWDGGFVWAKAPSGEPWIASAVQGEGCDLFWPCIDHPQGEPLLVDQHITVPAPLVAAGNGVAMGMQEKDGWRTWHWRTRDPNTYAIALNIGPYEEMKGEYHSRFGNTIPLRFWHLRGREQQARELFAEFPQVLDFFERNIGPYPFGDEKMGVVETPHLGMEHQTINAYGNDYKKDKYGYDWLLQHEFAHEWFGNQLTNTDWDDMWLHEGFGSYMQPLYLQYLRGDMEYHAALLDQRAALANKFPIVSGKSQTEEAVYNREHGPGLDIYYKGSLMLHSLRSLIGDEAFFASIRRAVYGTDTPKPGQFKPRYVSTRDYIDIVRQVTGKDYGWFFDVYLYRAALPELLAERDATGLSLRWKTPDALPFPLPVDVRVGGNDGPIRTVAMSGGQGHLALAAGETYTLDPHSKLLQRLPHIEAFQRDAEARRQAAESARKK